MRPLDGGGPRTAFFVNGRDAAFFWNAVMCGPVAFRNHWPILLVQKNAVPAVTNTAKSYYATRYVVGTTTDVYDGVVNSIKSGGERQRIAHTGAKAGAGYSRQELSRYFAEVVQNDDWMGEAGEIRQLGVTNKIADSLAGGVLMGKKNGVILFSYDWLNLDPPGKSYMSEYIQYRRTGVYQVWFFGGLASVSVDMVMRINALLGEGD